MKNSKMKINTNRKPIDSHEIGRMQDFGAVMKGFGVATIPFYKKWWFATGSGVAVVGAIVIAVATLNKTPNTETFVTKNAPTPIVQVAQPAQEAFIKPAFKGFDVDYTSIWVNSGQAKSYALPSGTVLKIPACHFTNANGNAIQGKVEIRYREMNDGVDFAVSGIPMSYDSAGQEYLFESAGMFEIQGWQNGQKVFVNPNCPITIEQRTVSSDGKFNMYYLDTANCNWQYIGKPNWQKEPETTNKIVEAGDLFDAGIEATTSFSFPSLHDERDKRLTELQKEIDALDNKVLLDKPKLMDKNKQNFFLVFDSSVLKGFNAYNTTIFGVAENTKFTPALYKYYWKGAQLDTLNLNKGEFKLSLYSGNYGLKTRQKKDIDSTWGNEQTYDYRRWYVRAWHGIRTFFGGKKYTPITTASGWNIHNKYSNYMEFPKEALCLIPIDSSQYNYHRNDYKNPVSFTVFIVYDSANYRTAMDNYQKNLLKRKEQLEKLWQEKEKLRKEIAKRDSLYAVNMALEWKKKREEALANNGINKEYIQATDSATQSNHVKIVNAFAASKFGIYNCDYPFKYSNPVTKTVTFKDEQGKNFYVGSAFIIVANKNALMNMNYSNCCDISMSYIKKHRNIFFTVLPDDRIAYFTTDDFNNLPDNQNVYIKLRISDKKMENISEVKTYLGLNSELMQ